MGHLLVTNDFPPKVGGIQSLLWEWWRRLPADRVTVLTTSYPGTEEFDRQAPMRIVRSRRRVFLPTPALRHEILTLAHETGRQQQLGERALHEQMRGLMSAPQVDAAAAESLRQRLQAGRDAASKRHLQAMLDASAVLTAEQRQKLAQKGQARREMMERHQQERRSLAPHG